MITETRTPTKLLFFILKLIEVTNENYCNEKNLL